MEVVLLLLRIAKRAPARAWGLLLPSVLDVMFGCGRRLVRREAAIELAGRGVVSVDESVILGGCRDARLLLISENEAWAESRTLDRTC